MVASVWRCGGVGFPVSGRTSSRWLHNGPTAEPWWPLCVNMFKKGKIMLYRQKRKEEGMPGVEEKGEEEGRGGGGREDPGWNRWLFPEGTIVCQEHIPQKDWLQPMGKHTPGKRKPVKRREWQRGASSTYFSLHLTLLLRERVRKSTWMSEIVSEEWERNVLFYCLSCFIPIQVYFEWQ